MSEELFRLLDSPDTVLVMPTQRLARHMAVSYAYSRKKALAADRILSFDTFSSMFEEPHGDRQRASLIVRTVFASSFLEENSDRLSYLFTADYPQAIPRFTSFIASILPSLGSQNARFTSKELFKDIQLIRSSYSAFLEKHSFYEPSWQKKNVEYFTGERNLSYCLVCPSCEPNMMRLMDTLGEVPFITSYECTEEREASFLLYDSEKAEITALFDQLEMPGSLHPQNMNSHLSRDSFLMTASRIRLRLRISTCVLSGVCAALPSQATGSTGSSLFSRTVRPQTISGRYSHTCAPSPE